MGHVDLQYMIMIFRFVTR